MSLVDAVPVVRNGLPIAKADPVGVEPPVGGLRLSELQEIECVPPSLVTCPEVALSCAVNCSPEPEAPGASEQFVYITFQVGAETVIPS